MKKNIKTIIISGLILLLYPFIGLSEFWEYIYVTVPAFIIVYSALRIMKQKQLFSDNQQGSFSGYVKKIVGRFPHDEKREAVTNENRRIDSLRSREEEYHHYE